MSSDAGEKHEDGKPGRMPVLLSAFVLPGAGQLCQRRWLAAILFGGGFMACFGLVVWHFVQCLTACWDQYRGLNERTSFDHCSAPAWSALLTPFLAGLAVYILGIIDTLIAQRRRSREWALRKLERRTGIPPGGAAVLVGAAFLLASLSPPKTGFAADEGTDVPPGATAGQAELDLRAEIERANRPARAEGPDVGALFEAVRSNDTVRLCAVLDNSPSGTVSIAINDGITPLHLASAMNSKTAVEFLICRGADVRAATTGGFTPLHWAALKDGDNAARALIGMGADVNARTRDGLAPLHCVAMKNGTNVLNILLISGADLLVKSEAGTIPLDYAVEYGAVEAALLLASKQAADLAAGAVAVRKDEKDEQPAEPQEDAPAAGEPPEEKPAHPQRIPQEQFGETLLLPLGLGETLSFARVDSLKMWVGKFEVTNGQYLRYDRRHKSRFHGELELDRNDQPVVYVSWNDAKTYCAWLNRNFPDRMPLGYEARLPTEREWIAVARCGDGRTYPWGNQWPPLYGNYSDVTAGRFLSDWQGIRNYDDGFAATCPVSQSGANERGIYGLAGNVWEWCEDWYDDAQKYKARHGGGWDLSTRESTAVTWRGFDMPDSGDDSTGFRIVIAPKP